MKKSRSSSLGSLATNDRIVLTASVFEITLGRGWTQLVFYWHVMYRLPSFVAIKVVTKVVKVDRKSTNFGKRQILGWCQFFTTFNHCIWLFYLLYQCLPLFTGITVTTVCWLLRPLPIKMEKKLQKLLFYRKKCKRSIRNTTFAIIMRKFLSTKRKINKRDKCLKNGQSYCLLYHSVIS